MRRTRGPGSRTNNSHRNKDVLQARQDAFDAFKRPGIHAGARFNNYSNHDQHRPGSKKG